MRVNITCKGFTANDKQVALIEKKFQKLAKYFSDDIVVNVTMGYKKKRQTMEAMIAPKGVIFRAEYTDSDMNVCLDKVVDRLASQITRYKKKILKNHKQNRQIMFDAVPESEELDVELKPVKSKTFDITPMDTDEAILQMELLDHSFFVFLNADTGRVAVVYKREDDQYGLLEPVY